MGEMIALWHADGKTIQKAAGVGNDSTGCSGGLPWSDGLERTNRERLQAPAGDWLWAAGPQRLRGRVETSADASGRVDVRQSLSASHCPSFLGELGNKSLSGE